MSKFRIAITCKDSSKIWSNGLSQNTYHLIKLLIGAGYTVDAASQFDEAGKYIEDIRIVGLTIDTVKNYDIIIEVCYSVTDDVLAYAVKNGVKIVTVNYGNILMIMQEDLILSPGKPPAINRGGFDVWISPHFEFSKGFVEITSKGNVKVAPYIWSPSILDKYCERNRLNPFYKNNLNTDKIGILEPNLNIIKTCIYPLIALEKLERQDSSILKEVLIFNGMSLKDNTKFKEVTGNFDLLRNKKLSMEGRFSLPDILSKKYVGTILSHQFYCDLNYLTLEALYMGAPIIHNSEGCKEAGYFYKAFDADGCIERIKEAINHRNTDQYNNTSRDVLHRYSAENTDNISMYKYLIENIS